jgi:dihydroxyacid dehydratase/phosphogluconate dehydratase
LGRQLAPDARDRGTSTSADGPAARWQVIDAAEIVPNQTVIRTPEPDQADRRMAVLGGNLAPRGAVINMPPRWP